MTTEAKTPLLSEGTSSDVCIPPVPTSSFYSVYRDAKHEFLKSAHTLVMHLDAHYVPFLLKCTQQAFTAVLARGETSVTIYFGTSNGRKRVIPDADGVVEAGGNTLSSSLSNLMGACSLGFSYASLPKPKNKFFLPDVIHMHRLKLEIDRLHPGLVNWKSSSLWGWSFDDPVNLQKQTWSETIDQMWKWYLDIGTIRIFWPVDEATFVLNVDIPILQELGCSIDSQIDCDQTSRTTLNREEQTTLFSERLFALYNR